VSWSRGSPVRRQSTRVALWATGLVALFYLVVSIVIVAWLTVNLTTQVDERLARALSFGTAALLGVDPALVDGATSGRVPPDPGAGPPPLPFGRERATWYVAADGSILTDRTDLVLPATYHDVTAATTIDISGTVLRVAGREVGGGHLVVGESMDPVDEARTSVILGMLLIAPLLLLGVFLGSLAIGRRVATPIERARQRQLAFTADASHELRTPLSVIEANAGLALAAERDSTWYRDAFERVQAESRRMRRLVEELLWLARFDAQQQPPRNEPVDLGLIVEQAADRFAILAEGRGQSLDVHLEALSATVSAPPDWLDQLVGVLLDNACRYTPQGGNIAVSVSVAERRVVLSVDDSGPGIAPGERERIFDRFHRASDEPGGSGLGLSIADAIVRATSGRWAIGSGPLGGTRMTVSWPAPAGTA
jgi:signal transduction histidine kinase